MYRNLKIYEITHHEQRDLVGLAMISTVSGFFGARGAGAANKMLLFSERGAGFVILILMVFLLETWLDFSSGSGRLQYSTKESMAFFRR